ncbi:MAG: hypothetical protein KIG88_09130 [Weeksellaceae bacterium]|nr:hypothetical protein [Weeksellaceae bacterium]
MKKQLFRFAFAFSMVATITSFSSCTDDDTEEIDEVNNRTHFNPPAWIQGKWILGIIAGEHHLLQFKTNNFLEVFPEVHIEKDYNDNINQRINELNLPTKVTETTISETIYEFNIDYSPESNTSEGKVIYRFTKVSNDKIQLQFLHENGEAWSTNLLVRYTR